MRSAKYFSPKLKAGSFNQSLSSILLAFGWKLCLTSQGFPCCFSGVIGLNEELPFPNSSPLVSRVDFLVTDWALAEIACPFFASYCGSLLVWYSLRALILRIRGSWLDVVLRQFESIFRTKRTLFHLQLSFKVVMRMKVLCSTRLCLRCCFNYLVLLHSLLIYIYCNTSNLMEYFLRDSGNRAIKWDFLPTKMSREIIRRAS